MGSFFDARCPKCRMNLGWFGRYTDRPPCAKCGHQLSAEQLAFGQAEMDAMTARVAAAENTLAGRFGRALSDRRIAAGLSLRQAADRLQVGVVELSEIEQGIARAPFTMADAIQAFHGRE